LPGIADVANTSVTDKIGKAEKRCGQRGRGWHPTDTRSCDRAYCGGTKCEASFNISSHLPPIEKVPPNRKFKCIKTRQARTGELHRALPPIPCRPPAMWLHLDLRNNHSRRDSRFDLITRDGYTVGVGE
jgi:hypothetical protein